MKGDIDKPGTDQGYTVEAAIPWAAFDKAANHPAQAAATCGAMNFYAMKNNGGRRVVADPRAGELPQGLALREGHLVQSEQRARTRGGFGVRDLGSADSPRHADDPPPTVGPAPAAAAASAASAALTVSSSRGS